MKTLRKHAAHIVGKIKVPGRGINGQGGDFVRFYDRTAALGYARRWGETPLTLTLRRRAEIARILFPNACLPEP